MGHDHDIEAHENGLETDMQILHKRNDSENPGVLRTNTAYELEKARAAHKGDGTHNTVIFFLLCYSIFFQIISIFIYLFICL